MTHEDLIHIKFNYEEALQLKKDILYIERSAMESVERLKEYGNIKTEKTKKETNLHKKIRGLIANIKRLQKNIPEVDLPKKITRKSKKEIVKKIKKRHEEYDSVEAELQEIQRKLKQIQR